MANNLKKTSSTIGSMLDLLGVIPDMGVRIVHLADKGLSVVDIKASSLLADVVRNDKLARLDGDTVAVRDQALASCQAEAEFYRVVDPTLAYDMKANVALAITRFSAALAA